eukprot:scaffold5138_cov170-Amphora_coffeaeformis.AAC.6
MPKAKARKGSPSQSGYHHTDTEMLKHHDNAWRGDRKFSPSLLLVVTLASLVGRGRSQVPGLVQSENGYDTLRGKDALCWFSESYHDSGLHWNRELAEIGEPSYSINELGSQNAGYLGDDFEGRVWEDSLFPTFKSGATTLMKSCPTGTSLHVDVIEEEVAGSFILRTGHYYIFRVSFEIDLEQIRSHFDLSDDSVFTGAVGMRVEFCPVSGSLCTPFSEREKTLRSHHGDVESIADAQNVQLNEQGHRRQESVDSEMLTQSSRYFLINNMTNNNKQNSFRIDVDLDIVSYRFGRSSTCVDCSTRSSTFSRRPKATQTPGNFLPIATLQFFLSNATIHGRQPLYEFEPLYKFDVANLVNQRSIHFSEPPVIREVDRLSGIAVYVLVTLCGAVQAGLLFSVLKNRNDSIMKLSQVYFLITLQVAGILATASTVFLNPRSDTFCRLRGPMTLISLQLMLAIMIGRLHRILVIMSPLLAWRQEKPKNSIHLDLKAFTQTFMSPLSTAINMLPQGVKDLPKGYHMPNIPIPNQVKQGVARSSSLVAKTARNSQAKVQSWYLRIFGGCCGGRNAGLRQEYTATQLNTLIFIVTFPIVVIEGIGLWLFDPLLTLHMSEDNSVGEPNFLFPGLLYLYPFSFVSNPHLSCEGRYECGDDTAQTFFQATSFIIIITTLVALVEANKSKTLPAFFNEAERVGGALLSSLFVGSLGFSAVLVLDEPTVRPDNSFIMEAMIICFMATILPLRVTLPKLRLIWKGEKVGMSSIMREHRESAIRHDSCSSIALSSEQRLMLRKDSYSSVIHSTDKVHGETDHAPPHLHTDPKGTFVTGLESMSSMNYCHDEVPGKTQESSPVAKTEVAPDEEEASFEGDVQNSTMIVLTIDKPEALKEKPHSDAAIDMDVLERESSLQRDAHVPDWRESLKAGLGELGNNSAHKERSSVPFTAQTTAGPIHDDDDVVSMPMTDDEDDSPANENDQHRRKFMFTTKELYSEQSVESEPTSNEYSNGEDLRRRRRHAESPDKRNDGINQQNSGFRRRRHKKSAENLMLSVINHSNVVSRVTERMLCGLEVDEDDWVLLQFSMGELETLLERRIKPDSRVAAYLAVPVGSDDVCSNVDPLNSTDHDGRNVFGGTRVCGKEGTPAAGRGRRFSLWR